MQKSRPWILLVSGEVPFAECRGAHTSIVPMGRAYKFFRQFVPRDRIIVIASVKECLDWHNQSEEDKVSNIQDAERKKRQTEMWKTKKSDFLNAMDLLISEGGSDYDGDDVNHETLLRVIKGIPSEKYPKVIQYSTESHCKSRVYMSIFSHGNWSPKTESHFFYMPVASPSVLDALTHTGRDDNMESHDIYPIENIENALISACTTPSSPTAATAVPPTVEANEPFFVSPVITFTSDALTDLYPSIYSCTTLNDKCIIEDTGEEIDRVNLQRMGDGRSKPVPRRINMTRAERKQEYDIYDASHCHWQYLFDTFHHVFTHNNVDAFFVFQQSCGSGGMWEWLRNPRYIEKYGVDKWPLFAFFTAEPETSAVGSAWEVFYELLAKRYEEIQQIENKSASAWTFASLTDSHHLPPSCTFIDLFQGVADKYYSRETLIRKVNFEMTSEEREQFGCSSFGVLGRQFGASSNIENYDVDNFFFSENAKV